MDILGRSLAPITAAAFEQIDSQAVNTLRGNLSARKFVDVKGPYGWEHSSVPAGRFGKLEKEGKVGFGLRTSVNLIESRVDFTLDAVEMHNVDRGCDDPDLSALEEAAKLAAAFEDKVIYMGLKKAGIAGMTGEAENKAVELKRGDPDSYVKAIIDEIDRMNSDASIQGPFALVGGNSLRDSLTKLVSGRTLYQVIESNSEVSEFIYTPSYDGAFIVSTRGGDFELSIGGDLAVGYNYREADKLHFYITESFAFRILETKAFTPLTIK